MTTYLTIDELQIMRTLGITVTSTISSTSLIGGVLGHTTISIHLHEIQCSIQSTWQLAHIYIKSELLVLQVEHLILVGGSQQVEPGTNVGGIGSMGYEAERERFSY